MTTTTANHMSRPCDEQPPVTASPAPSNDAETDLEILREVPKQFAIDCHDHANWLVRKVVAARQYAEHVKAWAEQELNRAEREEKTLMFLFGRQAEAWARSEIEKLNGRRKSLSLPAGILGFRAVSPCLQVDDERVVLGWAKQNCPSAITVVEKLSRSVLKDYLEKTGHLPDAGAHIEAGGEKFFIR